MLVEPLEPTGEPGTYATAEPVPVGGDWKTIDPGVARLNAQRDADLPS